MQMPHLQSLSFTSKWNRDQIEVALGKVRHLLGEFDLKEPFQRLFCSFMDDSEWLNGTMSTSDGN